MEVKPVRELQCRAGGLEIRFSQVTAYGLLLFLVTSRNMLVLRIFQCLLLCCVCHGKMTCILSVYINQYILL